MRSRIVALRNRGFGLGLRCRRRPDRNGRGDKIIAFVRDQRLEVEWILETRVHADHLSAAPYIKQRLGGALGIGENIRVVQNIFGKVFNAGTEFQRDGSQFDICSPMASASRSARSTRSPCTRPVTRPLA